MKPLGDQEESKGQPKQQYSGTKAGQSQQVEPSFSRRFMAKHGWNCFMIERQASPDSRSNFVPRNGNENKRASSFFSLRENTAGGLETLLNSKDSFMQTILEDKNDLNPSPEKAGHLQTPKNSKYLKASENLESTPRIKVSVAPGIHNSATRASQHIFVSPNKKTVLKR